MSVDSVGWVCLLLQDHLSNILVNTNRHPPPAVWGGFSIAVVTPFLFFLPSFVSVSCPNIHHYTAPDLDVFGFFLTCHVILSSFRCFLTHNCSHFVVVFRCSPVSTVRQHHFCVCTRLLHLSNTNRMKALAGDATPPPFYIVLCTTSPSLCFSANLG